MLAIYICLGICVALGTTILVYESIKYKLKKKKGIYYDWIR